MKPRTKVYDVCHNVHHLRTITDMNGDVLMELNDMRFRDNNDDYRRLQERMSTLNSCMVSSCNGVNKGKIYYWQLHKVGGPAYIRFNSQIEWYIKGNAYTNTISYCEACGFSKLKTMQWKLKYGTTLPEHLSGL